MHGETMKLKIHIWQKMQLWGLL